MLARKDGDTGTADMRLEQFFGFVTTFWIRNNRSVC